MSWRTKLLLAAAPARCWSPCRRSARTRARRKSLLPPGFGDNQNLPPPAPKARAARPAPQQQQQQAPQQQAPQVQAAPTANGAEPDIDRQRRWATSRRSSSTSRRCRGRPIISTSPPASPDPTDVVGPLEPGNFGLGENAFGAGQRPANMPA